MFSPHLRDILMLALASARAFSTLTLSGRLHRSNTHRGAMYLIDDVGTFTVFRETDSSVDDPGRTCVLVVGFSLKIIGTNPLAHWLFQRVCLLTAPFWSGLPGFRVNLWMVDQKTKAYGGPYDWRGETNAQRNVNALVRVLAPLSNDGSAWYRLYPDQELVAYLDSRSVAETPA